MKEPESDHEELQLVVNGQRHDWSMLFHRTADRAVLSGGSVVIDGEEQSPGDVILYRDRKSWKTETFFPWKTWKV